MKENSNQTGFVIGIYEITFLFFLFLGSIKIARAQNKIIPGAYQLDHYIKILGDENIGIVTHQASLISGKTHLSDTLMALNIDIKKVFAPEHGFRGNADAGESVADEIDVKTGLPVLSLYGKNKKHYSIDCKQT